LTHTSVGSSRPAQLIKTRWCIRDGVSSWTCPVAHTWQAKPSRWVHPGQAPFPGQNWRESMDRARRCDFDRKDLDDRKIPPASCGGSA
jgi:hypothetical protein